MAVSCFANKFQSHTASLLTTTYQFISVLGCYDRVPVVDVDNCRIDVNIHNFPPIDILQLLHSQRHCLDLWIR